MRSRAALVAARVDAAGGGGRTEGGATSSLRR
eukprot:CAMPEP_0184385884 /NCGR_PEP_ID=MMETSP0007-20130409/9258_1 /TAXON_ID=97485 /ORGANISM="Prymnesium parvum, Strain Texoma1" /LENGTH=31 /DNA_ID= /DNA_START= /DNA_END= /DNA_ORIENTATION=